MDFVVSKVSMSVLALFAVSVLYGIYGGDMLTDTEGDLERILSRFADEAVWPSARGVETSISWAVPGLPDGGTVWLVVGGGIVEAHAGGTVVAAPLPEEVHTWSPTGTSLNSTAAASLDETSARLRAFTGQRVAVTSEFIVVDNASTLFVFAKVVP